MDHKYVPTRGLAADVCHAGAVVSFVNMDELLLYIRLEDYIIVDDMVAQAIGAANRSGLVALIQDAVRQQLVERWASAGEPVDLAGPIEALDNRALGIRFTDKGRSRVNALLARAHEEGESEELDESTRRALDQPRVDYATVMSDLAKS